jgi:hypothetical protein
MDGYGDRITRMTRPLLALAVFALVFAPGSLAEHDDRSASMVSAAVLAPTSDAGADGVAVVPPDTGVGLLSVVLPLGLALVLVAQRSWCVMPLAIRLGRLCAVPSSISRRGPPTFVA